MRTRRGRRRGEDEDADEDGDADEADKKESNGRMGPLLEKEIFGCLTSSLCVTQTLEWVAGLGLRCWRQSERVAPGVRVIGVIRVW